MMACYLHGLMFLCLFLSLPLPSTHAALEWHLIDNGTGIPSPSPRRDAALGYDQIRKRLIVFGGKSLTEKVLGDTLIYDLNRGVWRQVIVSQSPQPRFSMVYGASRDFFYVATGEGANKVYFNDIWRFDFSKEEWSKLPSQKAPSYYTDAQWSTNEESKISPAARQAAAGGIFPNATRFYISLGSSDKMHKETYSYSVPDMAWYQDSYDQGPYNPSNPHARYLHAGTMISEDELLIFGGCLSGGGTGGSCPASDSWIFNGKTKRWSKLESCATPRTQASVAMLPITDGERRVVLYGGEEEGPGRQVLMTIASPKEQIAVLNPDTGEWVLRETTGDIPSKRSAVSLATGETGVYMFGGYDSEREVVSGELYLLLGRSSDADLAPVQAECRPTFFSLIILHGLLMALAWGFFLPWGAFIARYLKHKDPLWFNLHKLFQIFGLLLAVGGFICGVLSVRKDHFTFVHAIVGLTATVIAVLQPFNALARPKPAAEGQRKSAVRFLWELIHAFFGRCGIGLGLANISLGVFLAHSHIIIWALWFAYLGVYLLAHFMAEIVHNHRRIENSKKTKADSKYVVKDIIPVGQLPPNVLEHLEREEEDKR